MEPDPLSQLEEWAVKAERRAKRAHRLGRLRAPFRGRRSRPATRRLWAVPLVLLIVLSGLWLTRGQWQRWENGPGPTTAKPYPTMSHPDGEYATSDATAEPSGPFDGTPAARYPRGEAGFVMPKAKPVKGWTAKQVAAALVKVRGVWIAMYLDRRSLVDHDPSKVLAAMAPGSRKYARERYRDPANPEPAVLIADSVRLSDETPRVKGRTTVRAGTDDGLRTLEIVTNYVIVYPFDVPDRGPRSRIAIVHKQITWQVYRDGDVRASARGVWLVESKGYTANIDCAAGLKGRLAPWRMDANPVPRPDESWYDPDSFYDPDRSLDIKGGCQAPRDT